MLLTLNWLHFSWYNWLPKFLLLPYTCDGIKDAFLKHPQQKRSCFAPFSKRFVSTLIVFVSFSPVHTTTPYPFWKHFYNCNAHAQERSHMVASVRRSSGLAPSRVYLMTSPFSDSIVFTVHTRKQPFEKASYSNRSTLESFFDWLRFRWSFSAL